MSPTSKLDAICENVELDDHPKTRCCFGKYRLYGPDSTWSWIVAFCNFVIHFLVVGLGRMSGILYVDFMNTFGVDRRIASIPFSVQQSARSLFGPLAGIIGQKYGLRNMSIFGGFLAFLGATILYFKLDMTHIIIFWGLIFGIGAAFTTTLNQISIDQCFDRNRATAGGFAVSGGCVGAFIFPFVLQLGIAHFELKGTFLLMGSFLLFTIPAAFMLVDPPWKETDVKPESSYRRNIRHYGSFEEGLRKKVVDGCNSSSKGVARKELPEVNKNKNRIDFSILRENRGIVVQLLTREISNGSTETIRAEEDGRSELVNKLEHIYSIIEGPKVLPGTPSTSRRSTPLDSDVKADTESEKKSSVVTNSDDEINSIAAFVEHFVSEKELFPIQSKLQKLYERDGSRIAAHFHYDDQPRVCKILTELRKLYETLTEEPGLETIYNKAQYFKPPSSKPEEMEAVARQIDPRPSNSFLSHLKTAVRLHKNPVFILICLCRAVFMLTFVPAMTTVVDFAMDQGLERAYGNYSVSALSLGDLIGRVGLGWVTDRKYLSLPKYTLVVMVFLGANSVTLPFLHSEIQILAAVLIYGILQGSLFIRHPMLVSQFMASEEQSVGMGCINLLSGIIGFALPAFIGYFRDTLGSYDEMFYLNGVICVAVGLLWGFEPFFPTPAKVEDGYHPL